VQALAFLPSQAPLQIEPSLMQALRLPCGAPITGRQVPFWTSQASQRPMQPLSQQTPSAQKPLAHSREAVQAIPFAD
jgi:hypothetical protein